MVSRKKVVTVLARRAEQRKKVDVVLVRRVAVAPLKRVAAVARVVLAKRVALPKRVDTACSAEALTRKVDSELLRRATADRRAEHARKAELARRVVLLKKVDVVLPKKVIAEQLRRVAFITYRSFPAS
jgi:hypothetical protein